MYVTQSGNTQKPGVPRVVFATPEGIYRLTLEQTGADLSATLTPDSTPGADE
jgi:hypothetical protein